MSTLLTFAIYFGVFAFIALAVLRRPAVAMGGLMCMFGLEQWAQSRAGFFYEHQQLTNFLMASVLVWAVIMRPIKGLPLVRPFPRVGWAILGLYAWAAFSLLWVSDFSDSLKAMKTAAPYIIVAVGLMPLVAGDLRDFRAAMRIVVVIGSPLLLMLLWFTTWSGRSVVFGGESRFASVQSGVGNPLAVASLSGWVALIAALMHFGGAPKIWQLLRWGVVIVAFAVLFKSESRGQLIALVVAGVACWPISRPVKDVTSFFLAVVGLVAFLAIAFVAFQIYGEKTGRWDVNNMLDTWQGSRMGMAGILLAAYAAASPLTWLVGLGSSASYDPLLVGGYPHLVVAEVLGELGLIGLSLLLTVWCLAGTSAWKLIRRMRPWREERGLVAVMVALLLYETILTFKQGSMLNSYYCFGFAMVVGRLEVVTRPYETAPLPAAPYAEQEYGELDEYGPHEEWADHDPELAGYLPEPEHAGPEYADRY